MMTKAKKLKKSKKSTNKKRTFSVSPLIPIIAMIEVLVLIAVSTYAWFFVQSSKVIGSGTISVAADSGLDIDFQYSNVDDYINIWNYVGSDFKFEPATSMDGRMIYFPTSGSFNQTNTRDLVLRDGTVNDINSKYLSIDFELTNTSEYDQYVYLNNNSYFHVLDRANEEEAQESRALRLAFYTNDGNSGNVGSDLLQRSGASDGGEIDISSEESNAFTIYFDNSATNWGQVYAHIWHDETGTNNDVPISSWPGVLMTRVSGQIYSLTFENEIKSGSLDYNKVIFNNNYDSQTGEATLTSAKNGYVFSNSNVNGSEYAENTVYFVKPKSWTSDPDNDGIPDVYCHAWHQNGSSTSSYTTWPGDKMNYVGSGIYSYSYSSTNTGGLLFDNGGDGLLQTNNITGFSNGDVYYCSGNTTTQGGKTVYAATRYQNGTTPIKYNKSYVAEGATNYMKYNTVYLFNAFAWSKPYAVVNMNGNNEDSFTSAEIAMTNLSGNVFYCTVPDIFTYGYFKQKGTSDAANRTQKAALADQTVYRPGDTVSSTGNLGHPVTTYIYADYIKASGYPVISPGVSAGFQRPYAPVLEIEQFSGAATKIIPAYSNSIDNYILGSGTPLFVLKSGHMASLSMIMWLEGTDEACFGDTYPGNLIDLKLEFSTEYFPNGQDQDPVIVNPGDSNAYIYNFYDKTREIWTSDRQATESGVTVAPVMQLYDDTTKRGYLMHATKYASYDGKQKVSCWSVSAPQSIALNGHKIIFRRVNPYNEDEVWNYWYAGSVAGNGSQTVDDKSLTVYSIAQSTTVTTNDTINFTAFADGSPLPTMTGLSTDTDTTYNVPDVSCGGLWGKHETRMVTVYDGLPGQPLKDNNGVLTVNYSYPYKVGASTARTAKIEYKASGPSYNSFYYVVMPEIAYANELQCCFKRYTGFNDKYAINSAENNPDITFVGYYGKGATVSGDYFELNRLTGGDNTDYSYWGSDMLYVQTNADTKNYVYTSSSSSDSNAKLLQVHFAVSTLDNDNDSDDRFVYLYYNGNFSPNDGSGGSGYACVVPNDKAFAKYRVENCKYDGSKKYNVTSPLSISTASSVSFSDSYTGESSSMSVRYLDQNGVSLTYIGITLHLQTTHKSYGNDPQCHVFNSSDQSPDTWPGYLMKSEGNIPNTSMTKYTPVDGSNNQIIINVSRYNKIIFAYYGGSSQSQTVTLNMNDVSNDMVYESNGGNGNVGLVSSGNKETLRYDNNWTSPDWPHLTFQS